MNIAKTKQDQINCAETVRQEVLKFRQKASRLNLNKHSNDKSQTDALEQKLDEYRSKEIERVKKDVGVGKIKEMER